MVRIIDRIEHAISTVELREDYILVYRYRDGLYLDLEQARDLVRAAGEMLGRRAPLPTMVVTGEMRGITRPARDFFSSSPENRQVSSRVALIFSSRIGRMLINLFMNLSPQRILSRAFAGEERAIAWLLDDSSAARRWRRPREPFEDIPTDS